MCAFILFFMRGVGLSIWYMFLVNVVITVAMLFETFGCYYVLWSVYMWEAAVSYVDRTHTVLFMRRANCAGFSVGVQFWQPPSFSVFYSSSFLIFL